MADANPKESELPMRPLFLVTARKGTVAFKWVEF